jgi:hypothetical protein
MTQTNFGVFIDMQLMHETMMIFKETWKNDRIYSVKW